MLAISRKITVVSIVGWKKKIEISTKCFLGDKDTVEISIFWVFFSRPSDKPSMMIYLIEIFLSNIK